MNGQGFDQPFQGHNLSRYDVDLGAGGGGGGHRRGGDGTGGKSVSSGALVVREWEGEGGCS